MSEERPTNLPLVRCCATCAHVRGAFNGLWCTKWEIDVLPYTKCDNAYQRTPAMPLWVLVEKPEE